MNKFEQLVKAAAEYDESIRQRQQDMEKKAMVERYMNYGISYDMATELVKTAGIGKALKEGYKAFMGAERRVPKETIERETIRKTDAAGKETAENREKIHSTEETVKEPGIAEQADKLLSHAESLVDRGTNLGKKVKDAIFPEKKGPDWKHIGMGVAGGAAVGAGGLALGTHMARNSNRFPEYEKQSSVRTLCRTDI